MSIVMEKNFSRHNLQVCMFCAWKCFIRLDSVLSGWRIQPNTKLTLAIRKISFLVPLSERALAGAVLRNITVAKLVHEIWSNESLLILTILMSSTNDVF